MTATKTSIEINAPRNIVYEVVSDFESYPDFLPETKKVYIEEINDKKAIVTFALGLIKKITYTLEIKLNSPRGIAWDLIKGDIMKKNKGAWKLNEKKGITTAEYEIEIDFGGMVPKAVSSKLIGSNLPAMMKAFRDRSEDLV